MKVEFVALQRLIPEMLDFLRHSVGPNIVIHVEISPEVCAIEVDANQLELALINLAVNARDAMPQGGSLTIACHNEENGKRIGLPRDPFVCITVTDTGEGMSEATLARAQEPFFTTKGVGKGTGLGLSMVHGFAAQSGGAMRMRSQPGQGTSVTIWLPRAKEGSKAADAELPPTQPNEARSLRVLLVDDDILVSMGAADMLLDLGHSVTEAQSGPHALKLLETDAPFDIVVTDYAMPGMNGFELAQRIKKRNPKLPIVLATGYAELPADRSIEFCALIQALYVDGLGRSAREGGYLGLGARSAMTLERRRAKSLQSMRSTWSRCVRCVAASRQTRRVGPARRSAASGTRHDQPNPNSVEIRRIHSAASVLRSVKGWVALRGDIDPIAASIPVFRHHTAAPFKTVYFSAWIHGLGNGDRSQHLHAFTRE